MPYKTGGLLRLIALCCLAIPVAAGAEIPSPLPLDWCLERAEMANPTLAAAAAFAESARHRIRPAGSLEDPRFSYEASNVPIKDFDFDSTPMSGHELTLRQKLPIPGLLSNRADAEREGARSAEFRKVDLELATAGTVETAWAELGFAQRALSITRRNIALLRQLTSIAETKYRVGTGLQQDVLRAQVELTALLQEELRRVAAIESTMSRLAALLDMPAGVQFPETADLGEPAAIPALDPLIEIAESRNAGVLALAARIAEEEHRVRAVELEGYPDLDLGIGYRVRRNSPGDPVNGDDFVSAGLTVRLPVDRGKWRARVAERKALLRRARAEHRAGLASVRARVRSAHAELVATTLEEALLETGLVPQAHQSLEASRSGYEVGRVDFPGLLDTQVRLLDAQLQLVRARTDRRRAYATLEVATGEKLR